MLTHVSLRRDPSLIVVIPPAHGVAAAHDRSSRAVDLRSAEPLFAGLRRKLPNA
jgi:hypothetical protein